MRIVFLGTPDFAVKPLQKLIDGKHEIIAVVCNLDKQANRGHNLTPPPTKILAQQNGIPVFQYKSIRKEGVQDLKNLQPDIMVTCAFGQILSKEILDIAPTFNIHASLLPKYRGPAPIQWAVANGETHTGVTIMRTDEGVDTGDIICMEKIEIKDETSEQLFDILSNLGAEMIVKALDLYESGKITYQKQNEAEHTYFPMIQKDTFKLDFSKPATKLVCEIRAAQPWPVAYFTLGGDDIKVYAAKAVSGDEITKTPGVVLKASSKAGLVISTGKDNIEILTLQAPNGKIMPAKSYLNGKKIEEGTLLI